MDAWRLNSVKALFGGLGVVYQRHPGKANVLAAIEEQTESSLSVPVCLCPWLENPYRLVTLWDILMVFCSGERLFWAGGALETLKTDCFFKTGLGQLSLPPIYYTGPIDEETIDKSLQWLALIQKDCELLGMPVSAETASDIQSVVALATKMGYQSLQQRLDSLRDLIRKEMKTKVFFHVTPERLRFWPSEKTPYIFGEQVGQSFPSANFDISEAGICLALARATASVFHLMRVLELGLAALGNVFGISLAHTNWAPAIEQIESRIRDMHKDPVFKLLPDCKEQQEFYAQAASHFGILKDAWRNYTNHARGKHTEEEATAIFDNVRGFMQKLATRLHE